MATTAAVSEESNLGAEGKKAVWGAFLGFFVDMYSVYLPVVVLAPAIIYFVSPELSPQATAIVQGGIFASALIGRPIGAFIFGHFADTVGRKRVAMISVAGFGIVTLIMALLPGYETLGIAAVVIFIFLRLIDGIFLGGEYTAASPLAMEYSPKEKRGLYGGLIMTGFPLAYVAISLITFLLLAVMPSDGLDSAYVQWGWRIPFFIGTAMALAFVVYYHFYVSESELWQESSGAQGGGQSPLRNLFTGQNRKNFLQVFVTMTGFWFAVNTMSAILPGTLGGLGLSGQSVSATLVVVFLVASVAYVVAGLVSQRMGRRAYLMVMGVVSAVAGALVYYVLASLSEPSLLVVMVLSSLLGVLSISIWGLATTYVNERFRTEVRASGFGLGYSLAVVIPAFYAFYQAGLSSVIPFEYTPLVFLVLSGILVFVGAAWGPETKDVDFRDEVK